MADAAYRGAPPVAAPVGAADALPVADAASLLQQLHGQLLRLCCTHSGTHFEGLAVAGRRLAARGKLSRRLQKKLQALDTAAAWVRHVSAPLCAGLVHEVLAELQQPSLPQKAPPEEPYLQQDAKEEKQPSLPQPHLPQDTKLQTELAGEPQDSTAPAEEPSLAKAHLAELQQPSLPQKAPPEEPYLQQDAKEEKQPSLPQPHLPQDTKLQTELAGEPQDSTAPAEEPSLAKAHLAAHTEEANEAAPSLEGGARRRCRARSPPWTRRPEALPEQLQEERKDPAKPHLKDANELHWASLGAQLQEASRPAHLAPTEGPSLADRVLRQQQYWEPAHLGLAALRALAAAPPDSGG